MNAISHHITIQYTPMSKTSYNPFRVKESNTIYGLWYYYDDSRSCSGISENPNTLVDLHDISIRDPSNIYHNYKHQIKSIKVLPIDIYEYNRKTKSLEPIQYSEILRTLFLGSAYSDGSLYAINGLPNSHSGSEVLVYLSKYYQKVWYQCSEKYSPNREISRECMDASFPDWFYTKPISCFPVRSNIYYSEGIVNIYDGTESNMSY